MSTDLPPDVQRGVAATLAAVSTVASALNASFPELRRHVRFTTIAHAAVFAMPRLSVDARVTVTNCLEVCRDRMIGQDDHWAKEALKDLNAALVELDKLP